MTSTAASLRAFLDAAPDCALAEVREALGSTPREVSAWMLIGPDAILGTIGGGQLEFMAIDKAREMMRAKVATSLLDVPLGPEIGQCCGGRVTIDIALVDGKLRAALAERADCEDALRPHVYLFGGGHVGHAMASALALLPVRAIVVETRADALVGFPEDVETRLTAVPEEMVRNAPVGSAYVVLTHDHALDFLIVAEALKRVDAAYVGMIGSQTKKATFRSWFLKTGGGDVSDFARLVSPIGGETVRDKRPSVIAALAAAEIMSALVAHAADQQDARASKGRALAKS